MQTIRQPAVAGLFYSADPQELHEDISHFLDSVRQAESPAPAPKALIAPHAGYIYSGPVAASAYARLLPSKDVIKRVVLLGPSHRVYFHGLATSSADYFSTPLGKVKLDREAIDVINALPQVNENDAAHLEEHSLEVHLPFLLEVLESFELIPLVVGEAGPNEVAEVLEMLWGGPETLIVISSDLSHYHDYATAKQLDQATSEAIVALKENTIHSEDACGCRAVNGLLQIARARHMQADIIDLRNSGDTAGPKDRVVGYGSYIFH